jgi:hypothetical protein
VSRTVDPVGLLDRMRGHVVRLAYEPPTLSELFRAAVVGEAARVSEVSGAAG